MTLQQILYFREIAHTQNYTQAAQNLFIAQSSLSHSIQSLENEVGVPLFERKSGKRVTLTKYGETFLPHAEQILRDMAAGQHSIDVMRKYNNGIVTIAYSYINCFDMVSHIFKKFYEEHSYNDIAVRFTINQTRTMFEKDVAAGDSSLAFSCTPTFEGLVSVPIVKQELFLMVPVNHPLAQAERLSLNDVKDELFFGYYQNWNMSNWITHMFEQSGLHQNVAEYFPDWASQLAYVAMGLGLAITPMLPINPDLIRAIPIDHPDHLRPVYLHYSASRKLSPSAKYVKEYCMNFFKGKDTII